MYRFIVLYVCIYVAPWTREARHFVPLYVPTCSGMTIKLNLNLNLNVTNILHVQKTKVEVCINDSVIFLFITAKLL